MDVRRMTYEAGGTRLTPSVGRVMIPQYEIFRKLENKQVCWVESAMTLEDAKNRLRDLALMFPGDYFIFDAANRVFVIPAENPTLPVF